MTNMAVLSLVSHHADFRLSANPELAKRIHTDLRRMKGKLIEKRDDTWHPEAA
jgi:hypothetical protein